MGIRRKSIRESQKEEIRKLLETQTPRQIRQHYVDARNQISLSEIYKIRREKQHRLTQDTGEFLGLLRKWHAKVKFLLLGDLLEQYWFGGLPEELLHQATEPEGTANRFEAVLKVHAQSVTGPPSVPVGLEDNETFIQLRQFFSRDELWATQDAWSHAYGAYVENVVSWCGQIKSGLNFCLGETQNDTADHKEHGHRVRKQKLNLTTLTRLLGMVVSCDLLIIGIGEKTPSPCWFIQADSLRLLRAKAIDCAAKLPGGLWMTQYDFDCQIERLWKQSKEMREDTSKLLDRLNQLGDTSARLRQAIKQIEHHLVVHA